MTKEEIINLIDEIIPDGNYPADKMNFLLLAMLDYAQAQGGTGGGGVQNLQEAYDGGNVVNNAIVIIDGDNFLFGVGLDALGGNTGNEVNALGAKAAENNTGNDVNALGNKAALLNTGNEVNALGSLSGKSNTGNHVNALGNQAGENNTSSHCNFFGSNAGNGNTTPFGVTVFSPESIPSYADHTAALASLTTANGCVSGQIYLYRNEDNNTIGFVIP